MRYRVGFERALIAFFLFSNMLVFQNCAPSTGFDAAENSVAGGQDEASTAAPSVDLGSDKSYSSSASVSIVSANSLSFTAEIQNAGDAPVFSWTQISGPTQISFSTRSQPNTSVRNLTYGRYEVRLQMKTLANIVVSDNLVFILSAPSTTTSTSTTTLTTTTTIKPVTTTTLKPVTTTTTIKPVTTTTYKPGATTTSTTQTPTTSTTTSTTISTTTTTMPTSGKAPVVTLSSSKVLTARPVASATGALDPVIAGREFMVPGIVVDDGQVVSCKWKQISGPNKLNFVRENFNEDSSNSDIPGNKAYYCRLIITGYTHGEYQLQADATDSEGRVGSDTVKLIFPKYSGLETGPQLINSCGVNECIVSPGYSAGMTDPSSLGYGISSAYKVGKIRDFGIRQLSGPNTARMQQLSIDMGVLFARIKYFTYGTYEFEFYMIDSEGRRITERAKITFVPPVVGSFVSGSSPAVNPRVVGNLLNAEIIRVSTDISNETMGLDAMTYSSSMPSFYNWKQISGPTNANFLYKHVNPSGMMWSGVDNLAYGTYVFEASVGDERGIEKTEVIRITTPNPVLPANPSQAPVVTLSSTGTITVRPAALVSGPVNFVESGQEFLVQGVVYDDGTIVSNKWTQVSGPSTLKFTPYVKNAYYGARITGHTYGTYELRLEATDNLGNKGSSTVKIIFPRGL